MKYTFLILFVISGCALEGPAYSVKDYVEDLTVFTSEVKDGDYIAVFASDKDTLDRNIVRTSVELQKLVHNELVPDSPYFYGVTIFVPSNRHIWDMAENFLGHTTNVRAYTVDIDQIYILYSPEYWRKGTDKDHVRTFIHELMHHVSREIYGDSDPDHSRAEFWGPNGLVNQLTDQYIQETE